MMRLRPTDRFHSRLVEQYEAERTRLAAKLARKLRRKGRVPDVREVWGELEARAYMNAGWHPVSTSGSEPRYTLRLPD